MRRLIATPKWTGLCSYSLLSPCNQLGLVEESVPPSHLNGFCASSRIFLKRIPSRVSTRRRDDKCSELIRATATDTKIVGDFGEPVSLGTVKLAADVNLRKLEGFLYQWGSSLTQNASLPLPAPIKVDKIDGGVRIGYIKVINGAVEDLVHIDCLVSPATPNSDAMFRAVRSGRLKDLVPPGEPIIMQSLLQALRKSIELSKT